MVTEGKEGGCDDVGTVRVGIPLGNCVWPLCSGGEG